MSDDAKHGREARRAFGQIDTLAILDGITAPINHSGTAVGLLFAYAAAADQSGIAALNEDKLAWALRDGRTDKPANPASIRRARKLCIDADLLIATGDYRSRAVYLVMIHPCAGATRQRLGLEARPVAPAHEDGVRQRAKRVRQRTDDVAPAHATSSACAQDTICGTELVQSSLQSSITHMPESVCVDSRIEMDAIDKALLDAGIWPEVVKGLATQCRDAGMTSNELRNMAAAAAEAKQRQPVLIKNIETRCVNRQHDNAKRQQAEAAALACLDRLSDGVSNPADDELPSDPAEFASMCRRIERSLNDDDAQVLRPFLDCTARGPVVDYLHRSAYARRHVADECRDLAERKRRNAMSPEQRRRVDREYTHVEDAPARL